MANTELEALAIIESAPLGSEMFNLFVNTLAIATPWDQLRFKIDQISEKKIGTVFTNLDDEPHSLDKMILSSNGFFTTFRLLDRSVLIPGTSNPDFKELGIIAEVMVGPFDKDGNPVPVEFDEATYQVRMNRLDRRYKESSAEWIRYLAIHNKVTQMVEQRWGDWEPLFFSE